MVESSAVFRRKVQSYQRDLHQVEASVSRAHFLIKKEQDIGPGQCARIVESIRSAEEPLRKFSELLDTPDALPLSAWSVRHPLLIILNNAKSLLHSLIHDIDSLHIICRRSSYYEANRHREHILYKLNAFEQKREAILQDMDRLIIKINANT